MIQEILLFNKSQSVEEWEICNKLASINNELLPEAESSTISLKPTASRFTPLTMRQSMCHLQRLSSSVERQDNNESRLSTEYERR
jgi:hypothetical protein